MDDKIFKLKMKLPIIFIIINIFLIISEIAHYIINNIYKINNKIFSNSLDDFFHQLWRIENFSIQLFIIYFLFLLLKFLLKKKLIFNFKKQIFFFIIFNLFVIFEILYIIINRYIYLNLSNDQWHYSLHTSMFPLIFPGILLSIFFLLTINLKKIENNIPLLLHISTMSYFWIISPIVIDLVYLSAGGDRGISPFWGIQIPIVASILYGIFNYLPFFIFIIIILSTFILYIYKFIKNYDFSKANIINLISNIIFTCFYLFMTPRWIIFIVD